MLGWWRSLQISASRAGVISGVRGVPVICTSSQTVVVVCAVRNGVGKMRGGGEGREAQGGEDRGGRGRGVGSQGPAPFS